MNDDALEALWESKVKTTGATENLRIFVTREELSALVAVKQAEALEEAAEEMVRKSALYVNSPAGYDTPAADRRFYSQWLRARAAALRSGGTQ